MVKWLVLLFFLAVTLGWKLAARPDRGGEPSDLALQQRVAEFLAGERFTVVATDKIAEGQPMIRATAGACRLLVAKSPAMGWDSDLIRRHVTPDDRVFIVFRGNIYTDQPTWLTVLDFLWARFRRELGLRAHAAPVLAVIAASVCEAERLPWSEMQ